MAEDDDSCFGMLLKNSGSFSSARSSLCDVLRSLIVSNIEYFHGDKSSIGSRFHKAFCRFLDHLNAVEPQANEIASFAREYDYCYDQQAASSVPGNGYRSFVAVADECVVHCIRICRLVCVGRGSILFRGEHFLAEVEAHAAVMGFLAIVLHLLTTLRSWSEPRRLIPNREHSPEELLMDAEDIDTACFYGRCLGFQFCESMRKPLKFISLMMASFSDAYYSTGGVVCRTASSFIGCGRYAYYPEERARRIVDISHKASVDFCKAFWLLQENSIVQQVPGIMCPQLLVNKVLQLPVEPLKMPKQGCGTETVVVPVPSSHLGPSPVICRLLSSTVCEGQLNEAEVVKRSLKVMPRSPYLVIHVHGGGFVAQSSKSHEVYLRDWATELHVPILSVDYSLAPEAAFPRPLEECLFAYAWALNNSHSLGSTAEKVCLVGDSAGGNLVMGVVMKAVEMGIRKPDGVFALYTPLLLDFLPSPSRLLCLMDPLLPFGFMMRCMKAYTGQSAECFPEASLSNSECIGPASDSGSGSDCVGGGTQAKRSIDREQHAASVNSVARGVGAVPKFGKLEGDSDDASFEEVSATEVLGLDASGDTVASAFEEIDAPPRVVESADVGADEQPPKKDYVSEFMDWYILDVDESRKCAVLRSESLESEEDILFEMPAADLLQRTSEKVGRVTGRVLGGLSGMLSVGRKPDGGGGGGEEASQKAGEGIFANRSLDECVGLRTLVEEFQKFKVAQNHYISPLLAPDDLLRRLPPMRFLSLQLDPCLDDCVEMCKRLRSLGVDVGLDVVDGLPHGFLNFVMVSKDAHSASRLCVRRLRQMLSMPENVFE